MLYIYMNDYNSYLSQCLCTTVAVVWSNWKKKIPSTTNPKHSFSLPPLFFLLLEQHHPIHMYYVLWFLVKYTVSSHKIYRIIFPFVYILCLNFNFHVFCSSPVAQAFIYIYSLTHMWWKSLKETWKTPKYNNIKKIKMWTEEEFH